LADFATALVWHGLNLSWRKVTLRFCGDLSSLTVQNIDLSWFVIVLENHGGSSYKGDGTGKKEIPLSFQVPFRALSKM